MSDDTAHFDDWYATLAGSSRREELLERHLGLPPLLLVTGLVPWDGLDAITSSLRLVPDELLLDLACGRGGYGLEVAARERARLVGVDVSPEAVEQARANALAQAQAQQADFRVGDLAGTGLDDDSVDAVMCLDSVQFSLREVNTYAEVRRVLRPGGRVVMTAWEARDRDDEEVGRGTRTLDMALGLERAGFEDVDREVCEDWSRQERGFWEEAAALDAGEDAALAGLVQEARRVLTTFDRVDRVMVSATSPD